MSRKKTRAEDIRNPEHYFNRYIALDIKHETLDMYDRAQTEVSFEEHFNDNYAPDASLQCSCDELAEQDACAKTGADWIDYLDTPVLAKAVKALTGKQKQIYENRRLPEKESERQSQIKLVVEGSPVLLNFLSKDKFPNKKIDTIKNLLLGGLADV